MEILLVSATALEIQPTLQHLREKYIERRPFHYQWGSVGVQVLITGVGQALTAHALGKILRQDRHQLAVNAGIAGCFNMDWPLGKVVQVVEDQFADLGVEEADGSFTSIFELDLIGSNSPPFRNGLLVNEGPGSFEFLPRAKGLTVNRVHGHAASIDQIRNRFPEAEIETMESAAFFLACLTEEVPFLAVRALSNYVTPRQRENWNVPAAIEQLNQVIIGIVDALGEA